MGHLVKPITSCIVTKHVKKDIKNNNKKTQTKTNFKCFVTSNKHDYKSGYIYYNMVIRVTQEWVSQNKIITQVHCSMMFFMSLVSKLNILFNELSHSYTGDFSEAILSPSQKVTVSCISRLKEPTLRGHRIDCMHPCFIQLFIKAEGAGRRNYGLHLTGHCLLIPTGFILGGRNISTFQAVS